MRPMKFGFGQAPTRKEDLPLVTGIGRYVADHAPQGCLHAYVLRSPHAHARFRFTDLEAARAMPGVRLILTAADVTDLKPLPCFGKVPIVDAEEIVEPPYTVLATDVARHVGDAVAMIVADTLDQAKDAAEALAIDWEPLPHIVDAAQALKAGAPKVWSDRASNLAFESHLGEAVATKAAFEQAARVVALTLVNQRVVTNYMETRGVLAQYDPAQQKYTLTLGSQGSHRIRDTVTKIMNIGRDKMRVVTPDVGGGFGTKLFPFREYPLAAVAAQRTGRPVLWTADRTEHFLGDPHGRDNLTVARLALDENHKFLALDVDTIADMGAYLSFFAPFIPYNGSTLLPGVYHFPTMFIRIRGVFTNTLPVDAYRGAGRPEASYVTERLIDVAARDLSLTPDALRRKNFIKPKAMPYKTPTGRVYDSGDFAAHMKRAQDLADWSGFNKRLAASKKSGTLRGIGLATYIEACGGGDPEHVRVTLGQDGAVTVLAGSQSTGQGHQTAYAQLVAEHLDLPLDRIHVFQGDTDLIPAGTGTGGSRSIPVGGATVAGASRKLADNLKTLAADALEAGRDDLEIVEGRVRIVGTDRSVDYATLAKSSGATQELLSTTDVFRPSEATYPNGTHLCELEIDPDTGHVEIMQYIVVDDFGVTLNPEMLAGQVHGGIVQGIGQALLERALYDPDSGQLITATLTDYALPRADDVPNFTFETLNVPCKTNPLGVKGAGEAGAIGSCPAVMNAINDALWRAHRIRHIDMPATPDRVYKTLVEARREHTM